MARESQYRPDLHEPVLELIRRLGEAHAAGEGTISLLEIVQLFGATLEPDEEAMLRERGDLLLRAETESQGRFENGGSEVKFKKRGVTVTVPRLVKGTYLSFPDRAHFTFDTEHTIQGGLLFFRASLEDIQADQERIEIDLSGDSFDQRIIHRPQS
jgi:hypothetical protein